MEEIMPRDPEQRIYKIFPEFYASIQEVLELSTILTMESITFTNVNDKVSRIGGIIKFALGDYNGHVWIL